MSSEVKPKLLGRLKLGRLQCFLYGRPRQKPLFTEQAAAIEQLKKAVADEIVPILNKINRFLRKIGF